MKKTFNLRITTQYAPLTTQHRKPPTRATGVFINLCLNPAPLATQPTLIRCYSCSSQILTNFVKSLLNCYYFHTLQSFKIFTYLFHATFGTLHPCRESNPATAPRQATNFILFAPQRAILRESVRYRVFAHSWQFAPHINILRPVSLVVLQIVVYLVGCLPILANYNLLMYATISTTSTG